MLYQFTVQAGKNELFAKDAFQKSVGKLLPVSGGEMSTDGKFISGDVSEDGRLAVITMEIPDDCALARFLKDLNVSVNYES